MRNAHCTRKNNLHDEFAKTPSPENKAKYKKINAFRVKHADKAKIKYR